jgi:uncharacterized protein YegL
MPDNKGQLLPVYVLADESASMSDYIDELNSGLASFYETVRSEPMIAAKIRLTVIGFSDDIAVRLALADLRRTEMLPQMHIRNTTNYNAAFADLITRIPDDVKTLKRDGYLVHRPAVFFLSDGLPNNNRRNENWVDTHQLLTDKARTVGAPNIVAFGVGEEVEPQIIVDVATSENFAFISASGTDVGAAISRFFVALTSSVVQSGRSLSSASPELIVEKPEGFHMAIDLI